MAASQAAQILCCYKIAVFLGYLVKSSTFEMLKNRVWLPCCVPTLWSAGGRADRGQVLRKPPFSSSLGQDRRMCFLFQGMGDALLCPFSVPVWSPGLRWGQEGPLAWKLLTSTSWKKSCFLPFLIQLGLISGFIAPSVLWGSQVEAGYMAYGIFCLLACFPFGGTVIPCVTETPATKGLPAEQFSLPEKAGAVNQTLASVLISCLTELAPAVNFTVNSTCCSRRLFNHNIKKLNRNPIHTVSSSCLSCGAWGMILPSDGHPNANGISFASHSF